MKLTRNDIQKITSVLYKIQTDDLKPFVVGEFLIETTQGPMSIFMERNKDGEVVVVFPGSTPSTTARNKLREIAES